MLCHGGGDEGYGCCYVAGNVCPLRWAIVNGRVQDAAGNDLGTVDEFVNSKTNNVQARRRIKDQLTGVLYVCRAAAESVMADAQTLTNRARLNAAWDSHPDYVALVRPEWVRIEEELGLPAGSYQCSVWKGTGRFQCCFAEDPAVNTQKASGMSAAARQVRQAGGT